MKTIIADYDKMLIISGPGVLKKETRNQHNFQTLITGAIGQHVAIVAICALAAASGHIQGSAVRSNRVRACEEVASALSGIILEVSSCRITKRR